MRNHIKVLGAYGGKNIGTNTTSILINEDSVIDAGNILNSLGNDAFKINNIFLTHSHMDHICDIPFLIDAFFEKRETPILVYALKDVIKHLQDHIFNWDIWPDFCEIKLQNGKNAIEFIEVKIGEPIVFEDFSLEAIENNHTTSSCGYILYKEDNSLLFTSDTYCCDSIIDRLNNNKEIKTLITETSFPSRFERLAYDSKHLTPKLLAKELDKIKREDLTVHVMHLKPTYMDELVKEIKDYNILKNNGTIIDDNDIIYLKE